MTTEAQKANQPHRVEAEALTRRWGLILGLYMVILNLLASEGLLQSSSAAARQATSPSSPATATAAQETKPGAGGDLATIIQSRSTNTRAYNVVIHNDGSAAVEFSGAGHISSNAPAQSQQFPPGTIDTHRLRSLLAQIGDVSRIPIGFCAKSASFGTTTRISYAGKKSGDLQCVQQQASGGDPALLQASQELGKFVRMILNQLKIDARRVIPNQ